MFFSSTQSLGFVKVKTIYVINMAKNMINIIEERRLNFREEIIAEIYDSMVKSYQNSFFKFLKKEPTIEDAKKFCSSTVLTNESYLYSSQLNMCKAILIAAENCIEDTMQFSIEGIKLFTTNLC